MVLSTTTRYKQKFVTTCFYKPTGKWNLLFYDAVYIYTYCYIITFSRCLLFFSLWYENILFLTLHLDHFILSSPETVYVWMNIYYQQCFLSFVVIDYRNDRFFYYLIAKNKRINDSLWKNKDRHLEKIVAFVKTFIKFFWKLICKIII